MVADSPLPLIGGILVGIGSILAAIFTAVATRASRIAKAAELKVSAVDVSLDSLRQALERADGENRVLRADLLLARQEVVEIRERCGRCEGTVAELTGRIRMLEGRE